MKYLLSLLLVTCNIAILTAQNIAAETDGKTKTQIAEKLLNTLHFAEERFYIDLGLEQS
jgi:hypothetical protein